MGHSELKSLYQRDQRGAFLLPKLSSTSSTIYSFQNFYRSMTPSSEIAGAGSEARHELPEGVELQPFTPHSKSTKDEFEGSNSSIPSFPSPSPLSSESVRSSLVYYLSFPDPLNNHQTSPSPVGLRIPSWKSFPPSVPVCSLSSPAMLHYH
ncbi:hypothetical protein L6164_001851 [Bauhinia variegata]|uniref:Uncharacterized protein n=1 Tax=Bauhinia variegata TaxID=167791 RepID=A0ACB9QBU1_BAUVA|nr:hypothetical protein L6164_001851 [Bauhinia variegata]